MADLKAYLAAKLKKSKRVAVLGIGSELRADDAAGILAAGYLEKTTGRKNGRIRVFKGFTAPENLTGEIISFKPTDIIIIDSVEMGESPGTVLCLDPDGIGKGVSFSTHKLPAKILIDYFGSKAECRVIFIGIQPASVAFGRKASAKIKSCARLVASSISKAL